MHRCILTTMLYAKMRINLHFVCLARTCTSNFFNSWPWGRSTCSVVPWYACWFIKIKDHEPQHYQTMLRNYSLTYPLNGLFFILNNHLLCVCSGHYFRFSHSCGSLLDASPSPEKKREKKEKYPVRQVTRADYVVKCICNKPIAVDQIWL